MNELMEEDETESKPLLYDVLGKRMSFVTNSRYV